MLGIVVGVVGLAQFGLLCFCPYLEVVGLLFGDLVVSLASSFPFLSLVQILVLIREWQPDRCCVPWAQFFNARLLVPGLWVVWFPWVVPLVGLVACALDMGVSLLLSLVAYARAVGGVLVCLSFARGVGLGFFGCFDCWPVCGVWLDVGGL